MVAKSIAGSPLDALLANLSGRARVLFHTQHINPF
jgi:hypothetical protein